MKTILSLFLAMSGFLGCVHQGTGVHSARVEPEFASIRKAVLGVGDVIEVRIFDEPELSGSRQIGADGSIRMPLIGFLPMTGRTSEEAAHLIALEYQKKYLRDPDVSVLIQQSNSRKVYLLGEVKSPGPYVYEENMTLIGAIAKAGGTTAQSASNRACVTRSDAGKSIRFTAKVSDMGRGEAPDIPILPGDIIFVPQSIF
ncbi:MAG: polysaccharide biosynthesis/export family protein [Myxococcaceae bacterium]|nr:polysaccharide biosynthesis/export family protein [Myxococcaceae bacterium]MBH2005734.1 polysaccharide biosynthesis/export family protein [Myxococcaceae bacterium]